MKENSNMNDDKQKARAFLERDRLRYIVHLKMLYIYPNDLHCYYTQSGSSVGILLLLPTNVSRFDAKTYPSTSYVVFPASTDKAAAQRWLPLIPTDTKLVFKLISDHDKEVIQTRFQLRRITSFLSYTSPPDAQFTHSTHVVVSETLDETLLPLYARNGYQDDEVRAYFSANEAISFAIYKQGEPISACFAFPNFKEVWEIGAVHTLKSERKKGYAKEVVETALKVLQRKTYAPRYNTHEDNTPSIRLAQRLSLDKFLTMEHYLALW